MPSVKTYSSWIQIETSIFRKSDHDCQRSCARSLNNSFTLRFRLKLGEMGKNYDSIPQSNSWSLVQMLKCEF
jgi:hypothetical protein